MVLETKSNCNRSTAQKT